MLVSNYRFITDPLSEIVRNLMKAFTRKSVSFEWASPKKNVENFMSAAGALQRKHGTHYLIVDEVFTKKGENLEYK